MGDPQKHEHWPRRKDGACKMIFGARICGLPADARPHLLWDSDHQPAPERNANAIIAEWLATHRGHDRAPDDVWEAHLEIEGECRDDECRICFVYCEVCRVHYGREDTCPQH